MRRYKNLYKETISFQNLLKAARLAEKSKRFKCSTARFNFFLEKELWSLHHRLEMKSYEPGDCHRFLILEPKKRVISAAPYRDRVVHHAIHNILGPIFDPTFIYDSYATRKGKGAHAAVNRFQGFARKTRYALKCDIQKYFPSIDRDVLISLIKKKLACPDTLWLIKKILNSPQKIHDKGAERTVSQSGIGIPIGNLTSQFFANIYLDGLDHFIKEQLQCRCYVRYMDDFMICHDDKAFLWHVKAEIQNYLQGLRLSLHVDKCKIFNTKNGVPFLGLVVASDWRRLKRESVLRFKKRMERFQKQYRDRNEDWQHIHQSIQAWIGHAKHADTMRLRELIFSDIVFRRNDSEGD